MKRLIFVVTGVLLAIVILSVGCSSKPKPVEPAAPTTQNVTGILKDINTPAEAGPDTVTIQTPTGETKIIPFAPNDHFFLDGAACPLEEVQKVELGTGVSYNCSVWVDRETGQQNIYITK